MAARELAAEQAGARAAALEAAHGNKDAAAILRLALLELFPGRIALASSFGAESAVLLHMLSSIAPSTQVLLLDTGMLFPETLAYCNLLVQRLALTNVRAIGPDPSRIAAEDPDSFLWAGDPDRCCALRKVEPFAAAVAGYDAWVTGRKRHHGGLRSGLPVFEAEGPRIKINPIAAWSPAEVEAYFTAHELPRHPLVAKGFASLGCIPCTSRVRPGEEVRAGRWRGRAKSECGLHLAQPASATQGA